MRVYIIFAGLLCSLYFSACEKLVEIDPPTSNITTDQVFADSADANAALLGLYSLMYNNGGMLNGLMTLRFGVAADEIIPFFSQGDQFLTNTVTATNSDVIGLWAEAYNFIYQANASLEGLQHSAGLSDNARTHFTAEVKFIRAFVYFQLVNIWGDVPYPVSTNYTVNGLLPRLPAPQIYDSITADLRFAAEHLDNNFSYSDGMRVRASQQAAMAVLARLYLYRGDWVNAYQAANTVLNDVNFSLATSLNEVFDVNSQEAILQWRINHELSGDKNITHEGLLIIPYPGSPPGYYLRHELLNSFESGDHRRTDWIDSTEYDNVLYRFPLKYKLGPIDQDATRAPTQQYTILRLAEQYLIRAEAETHGAGGGLDAAVQDLNAIRFRAGLPGYSGLVEQNALVDAIMHERQIEFFAEWGHRWFDLKRTGNIDEVLGAVKPLWKPYQQLFPIPTSERNVNPNLTQNPGYIQ